MSLNYSSLIATLQNLAVIETGNAEFAIDLPNVIDYAELRLYRDLDLLDTSVQDASGSLTAGNRNFQIPSSQGTFIVTKEINVITPASATTADGGTRNQLVPTSNEVLNALWPSSSGSTVPQYFSMVSQNMVIVGPWPDAAYRVEAVGTIRPPTLSSTVTTTILTVFFQDLFIAAAMVRVAAFQKNYGVAVDDPQQGVTWETQYKTLLAAANVEEARKTFQGPGWSAEQPEPTATPPRT